MTDFKKAVLAIKAEFPKHSAAALSLAHNTESTGVMLCPRAAAIERSTTGGQDRAVSHAGSGKYKMTVRLEKPLKRVLNAAMKELGHSTVQAAIECAIALYIEKAAGGSGHPSAAMGLQTKNNYIIKKEDSQDERL